MSDGLVSSTSNTSKPKPKLVSVKFEVRFELYHYNNGADFPNGHFNHSHSCDNIVAARAFRDLLQGWLDRKADTEKFAQDYCYDGYLTEVHGIFKIVTKKIE